MIQKVLPGEYLKGYEVMTGAEREAYRKRVGEWLRDDGARLLAMTDRPMAQAQNLMQMSTRWSKEDCRALHEGAVMLTALMGVAETWLPSMLWVKSAWRGVRKVVGELTVIYQGAGVLKESPATGCWKGMQGAGVKGSVPAAKPQGTVTGGKRERQMADGKGERLMADGKGERQVADGRGEESVTGEKSAMPVPVRPKHIDQYLHLLPKGTQERGAMVRGLLRELDDARERVRLLMGSPQASPSDMAAWAKRATQIDNTLRAIYQELDREWEKLVKAGRVTVDALGQTHVVEIPGAGATGTMADDTPPAEPTGTLQEQKRKRRPMTEEERAARAAEREERMRQENQRKAGLLRKWLIDLRNAKTPEQQEKWKKKYKEMVKLGGEGAVTEKVKEAAEYYGVDINTLAGKPQGTGQQ